MPVPGAALESTIKERKRVQTLHRRPHGAKIGSIQRLFLRREFNGRQYHMFVHDTELIENEVVRAMQLRNKEILLDVFLCKRILKRLDLYLGWFGFAVQRFRNPQDIANAKLRGSRQ